jgi:hypothetical protein
MLLTVIWTVAQTEPTNPLSWLPALGPFAAAAIIFWLWNRDIKTDRDQCRSKLDERVAADQENRDMFRQAVRTIEANTSAMSAHTQALRTIETRMRALERERHSR